ncbi:MAG: IS1634 family transposase [Deltaproteobacteria bacterium]|nr:IS1634 family transposase [Deltaproteobacteria bacterium]
MFIRQTKTSTSMAGEAYYTFRLVASKRIGDKVRQKTLLNLGRNFSLPREQWPQLCTRIEGILSGQMPLITPSAEIEELAQRYSAQLIIAGQPEDKQEEEQLTYTEVDVSSLELVRPRSIGVEHVGMEALKWLDLPGILASAGLNGIQQAAAIGSIISRMADPGSELRARRWLTERSGLGELLEVDYETMPLMRLYRTSDLLVRHRQMIETALFGRINELFSLSTTVTLYDLTNTYFEGEMCSNGKARHGHSKEKRSDCPLVTLGLVLDGSGFVRRSRMFEGNVSEPTTLETMLERLEAPKGAMVIMDRGIATQANIDWLIEQKYRYLVVSRERSRHFTEAQATEVLSVSKQTIKIQRVISEDGSEVRLYCHSGLRQQKEDAMNARFIARFEKGLQRIAASLAKPRGVKQRDKVMQRVGRLQEKNRGIAQHYRIELVTDKSSETVTALNWEQTPVEGTRITHPGVYCLRTNELHWDETTLWRTYTMLTDLEAVFRSLKSELGMRPVYHQKEERAEGHLFITVLAYQAVQAICRKLKISNINDSWTSLRQMFSTQQRVTATFKQKDGRTLHVRKTTLAEPKLQKVYDILGVTSSPVGTRKMVY